jgi:energy-coupling factor transport system ATP-binding protein
MVHVHDDGTVTEGSPQDLLPAVTPAPSLVELGRWAGWDPLPLTVREARRAAAPLRRELAAVGDAVRDVVRDGVGTGVHASRAEQPGQPSGGTARPARLTATGIGVRHAAVDAVGPVDLQLFDGEVVALMGRNGSGKSSLLWALQGSGPRAAGHVEVVGGAQSGLLDPVALKPQDRRALVGLVPQSAPDLLYLETVEAECRQADTEAGAAVGTTRACLDLLPTGIPGDRHPRDLSEGQRLALVLAVQLSARPQVLLLDEPTRGLDYTAKQALGRLLRAVADQARAVVVATHDVEFAAATSDRVVVLAQGRTVADGPSREVLCDSPAFAPQVAKVLAPLPVLTLDQLRGMAPMLSQVAP